MVTVPWWVWVLVVLVGGFISILNSVATPKPQSVSDVLPQGFQSSLKIGKKFAFDDVNKRFCYAEYEPSTGYKLMGEYSYSDILDYQVLEDGNPLIGGGLGGAVAGGFLFGGAGAVAGSVVGKKTVGHQTILQMRIIMKSDDDPVLNFQWAYDSSKTNPEQLKLVHQFARKLDRVLGRAEQ